MALVAFGAGIQNTVLEAMAYTASMFTPPQAIYALDMRSGYEALVENKPPQISKTMLDILVNSERRYSQGQESRKYLEIYPNWRKIVSQLKKYGCHS